MDGIADMGGSPGWGSMAPPSPDEPVFGEPWQGRAFALALLSSRLAGWNTDAFRHALERLSPERYLDDGYFGRWLNGAELILTDSSVLAPGAVEARARNLQGGHVREPAPSQPVRPRYSPAAEGSLRTVDVPPVFAVGDRVRADPVPRPHHTRIPRYVRGHVGVVTAVAPASVLPDTNAHFQGENPQWVYTVRFDAHELWGAGETFAVTVEMYESYLENVT